MKLFSRHKEKKVLTSHYCQKGEKIIMLISLTVNKTYDAQTWTHHQCCLLEALGVYFLVRNSLLQAFRTWLIKSCVQVSWFYHHCSPLFNQSHLGAFSAAVTLFPMACLSVGSTFWWYSR